MLKLRNEKSWITKWYAYDLTSLAFSTPICVSHWDKIDKKNIYENFFIVFFFLVVFEKSSHLKTMTSSKRETIVYSVDAALHNGWNVDLV